MAGRVFFYSRSRVERPRTLAEARRSDVLPCSTVLLVPPKVTGDGRWRMVGWQRCELSRGAVRCVDNGQRRPPVPPLAPYDS